MESNCDVENKKKFYSNNFDLIRLFAALQVVHVHLITILGVQITIFHNFLVKFFGFFPGVPIFFFISGFLITRSWMASSGVKNFFRKRALRIFPALIFSVFLALVLVILSGYYTSENMSLKDLLVIFLAKITFFQFYNPDMLRGYGDGVLNGSLWTITVELQFYILTPLLFFIIQRCRGGLSFNLFMIGVFVLFYIASAYIKYQFLTGELSTFKKLVRVSFIPWFYMFILGALFQINFNFFYRILSGKFLIMLLLYITVAMFVLWKGGNSDFGNLMNPILFLILAALIFSAAYSNVKLSDQLLNGNDISYGAYIYHMPFINWIIFNNFNPSYGLALGLFLFIIVFSAVSWFLLERPCIRLK